MLNKHILAAIGLAIAVSAGGNYVHAGAFQELAGGPNFDGGAANKAVDIAPVSSDPGALASDKAAAARTEAAKPMASPVPTLAVQTENAGTRSPEIVRAEPSAPDFHPIEALRNVVNKISPALVCFGVGAFIGYAIAGAAGVMTGGLAFAAFALLGIFL